MEIQLSYSEICEAIREYCNDDSDELKKIISDCSSTWTSHFDTHFYGLTELIDSLSKISKEDKSFIEKRLKEIKNVFDRTYRTEL